MKRYLCLDPGNRHTAWLLYQPSEKLIINGFGKEPNERVLDIIIEKEEFYDLMLVEQLSGYIYTPKGAQYRKQTTIGRDVIDTAVWSGRFVQQADIVGKEHVMMLRSTVSHHLCKGVQHPGNSEVRAALIKRFGEKGTMKNPGLLYGVSDDIWSSLALGVSFCDKNVIQPEEPFHPGFL